VNAKIRTLVNKLVIENLKHRPIRTLLTVLAIGFQVTLMLTIVGVSRGMIEAAATRSRGVGFDITVRPPGTSAIGLTSAPMPEKMVAFVAKQPHVVNATGVAVYPIGPIDVLTGVDFERFTRMSKAFRFVDGGPFQQPDDILVDDYFAEQRKLKVGDKVRLANHDWTVRGIFASGVLARTMVQIKILQELTANTDRISMIYLKVDDPRNVDTVISSLKQQGLSDYQIYSLEQFLSLFTPENLPGLSQVMAVIVGLSVLFGFLIVFLAMYTAVLERTREIGILKALGGTPLYVLNILLRETVMLALVGTTIGILLTYVSRAVITSMYPATVRQVIVPDWWARALLVAVAGAVLGVMYPALKAARQDAVEALAYE
jgi:putative ABC transport system permease protein